ncbi:unnamed protein product [Amaranthus hypochondriacus]
MSRRNRGNNSNNNEEELELKLNLSATTTRVVRRQRRMSTSSSEQEESESPTRSCVSSEESLKYSSSPEATSMVLVGCPRCLMYVMLSEADPRCPKCKSTVLLDFLRNQK